MVNIGAIMEYGATIPMPNGNTIIISPRPFLHPTMLVYQKKVEATYRRAMGQALTS